MAASALPLHGRRGAGAMDAMTRAAVGGARLAAREHEHSMPAGLIFLALRGVAAAAKGGDFIGSGHAVRSGGAGGIAMLLAGTVAHFAPDILGEVFVSPEAGNILGMAGRAELTGLLR